MFLEHLDNTDLLSHADLLIGHGDFAIVSLYRKFVLVSTGQNKDCKLEQSIFIPVSSFPNTEKVTERPYKC